MGVITNSTFDPIKTYCNVRLQQGVPLVDADVNELDDIRKFEVRAYLKWFVGNGIPAGNDGFRIDAIGGVADDFWIRAGATAAPAGSPNTEIALRYVGRAIVDGLDVIIPADVKYKSQPMYSAPEVDGSPQIQPIPPIQGAVVVYLDVWERPVTFKEDPTLVNPALGTESCARVKREWCVRTFPGASVPPPPVGHSYYLLALLNRNMSGTTPVNIAQGDITDRRHTGLSLAGYDSRISKLEQQLLFPLFAAANSLSPSKQVAGANVLIIGRNFTVGTPVVTIGGLSAPLVGNPTPTVLTVTVPSLAVGGPYPVLVSTDGGGPSQCPIELTVLPGGGPPPPPPNPQPPTVTSVLPTSAKAGVGINILGSNFSVTNLKVTFNQGAASIAATIQGFNDGQITVTVPTVAPGAYTIHVSTDGGPAASSPSFTVTP